MRLAPLLLLPALLFMAGCATESQPYGEKFEPESPALPIDPHAAQPGSFTNRTDHTVLSDQAQ